MGDMYGYQADQTAAFGTIPGGVYTLLEKYVLRSNTSVMGARYVEWVYRIV